MLARALKQGRNRARNRRGKTAKPQGNLAKGRTIWIADAHRDGKRFVVRADEKLTAFLELETAIRSVSEALFRPDGNGLHYHREQADNHERER